MIQLVRLQIMRQSVPEAQDQPRCYRCSSSLRTWHSRIQTFQFAFGVTYYSSDECLWDIQWCAYNYPTNVCVRFKRTLHPYTIQMKFQSWSSPHLNKDENRPLHSPSTTRNCGWESTVRRFVDQCHSRNKWQVFHTSIIITIGIRKFSRIDCHITNAFARWITRQSVKR